MAPPEILPYGAWRSPITSDLIVGETIGLGDILVDGPDIYWIEGRPSEGGRNVLVRRSPDGVIQEIIDQFLEPRLIGPGPRQISGEIQMRLKLLRRKTFFPVAHDGMQQLREIDLG